MSNDYEPAAFNDEHSGKVLLCFFDIVGDWHSEYFREVRTQALKDPKKETMYFINEWRVNFEQFEMLLEALNRLAEGVLPIPDILEGHGT